MLNDTDIIPVVCESCGHKAQHQIGWLRARAGRTDFECAECHSPFKDYTQQLERVILNDAKYPLDKIRLYKA